MGGKGKSEEYVYSEEQINKLWGQCKQLTERVLVGLMMFCGLRIGEAIHLQLGWIREEEIHIPSTMACNCWQCSKRGHWKPKTKQGIRVVPIPGFFKPILKEFLSYQPDGLKITRQSGNYVVGQLIKKAKLPHAFPHSLRATCATTLAAKGFTAVELCYHFGWKRLEMGEHYIKIAAARAGVRDKMKQLYG